MLSNLIEDWARRNARRVGKFVAKTGLSPNTVTLIGFFLNFPVAYVLSQHLFLWGGFLILFAGAFDMLDGAVARVTGKMTKFGAFLDSTFDRFSEIVVLLGLLLYYRGSFGVEGEKWGGSILVYVAITGSLMVSYVKARAEGLDLEMKGVGLLPRPERVILLALACFGAFFFGEWALILALWILAVGTNLTALQRIMYVWLTTAKEQKAAAITKNENIGENPESLILSAGSTKEARQINFKELSKDIGKDNNPDKEKNRDDESNEALPRKFWSFRRVDGQ